jgi:Zn ribbon nucleic-acid-binding protein
MRSVREKPVIKFKCPTCDAEHTRGFFDGISVFRCLRCGYQGHGFHRDLVTDRAMFADHEAANAVCRLLGIPETPLGVDPLSPGC